MKIKCRYIKWDIEIETGVGNSLCGGILVGGQLLVYSGEKSGVL